MPGIDLGQVSSNWKKLQASLSSRDSSKSRKANTVEPSKSATNGVKRKRSHVQADENSHQPNKKAQKPIPASKSSLKRRTKMGTTQSTTTTAPAAATPAKSLLEDHDLSPSDLTAAYGSTQTSSSTTKPTIPLSLPSDAPNAGLHPTHKAGKFLALDCEMVGTGPPPATDSLLARVSVVNYNYEQVYDSYVQAPAGVRVTDYRTAVSGIRAEHLREGVARKYGEVQAEVAALLRGRVLVGHALRNDWAVLGLGHARRDVRDTSAWKPFRAYTGGAPRLRDLARRELGVEIQTGEHSSLEDARAAMGLFRKVKTEWEEDVRRKFGPPRAPAGRGKGRTVARTVRPVVDDDDEQEEDDEDDDIEDDDALDLLDGEEDEMDIEEVVTANGDKTQAKKKKRKKKKRTKRK